MSEFLYVCHFSNGHIKVGRSISPKSRIAAHADRVACVGIELIEHHIVECVGRSAPAEYALIDRCAALATKQNKNEWFEGLAYLDACDAAIEFAAADFSEDYFAHDKTPIAIACSAVGSQAKLARILGIIPAAVFQWVKKTRPIPSDKCQAIELACEAVVSCEQLRPDLIWVRIPDQSWPHPGGRPLLDFVAVAVA